MKKTLFFLVTLALIGFSGCSDDDNKITLPDITVNFESSEIGLSKDITTTPVVIALSRKTDVSVDVTISVTPSEGIVYGTDFSTDPKVVDNQITITIPEGSSSAQFTISRLENVLFEGDENIQFKILSLSTNTGFQIGNKAQTTVKFNPIVSTGDQLTLNGKTETSDYTNSVYVDFSANTQTAVNRKSWNLGFYNGDDFRVILNAQYATTAIATNKTNIKDVTYADTLNVYDMGANHHMTAAGLSLSVVDPINGSLSGTVFDQISEDSSKNLVYFVASEDNKSSKKNWYKVKVDRSSNGGYRVQYANVGDSEITTIEIAKDANYNMSFLSFTDENTVSVEPVAKGWDIMWGYSTGLRYPDLKSAYFLQDYVTINTLAGVEAVEVLTSTTSYADFTKANIVDLKFSSDRSVIGDSWRNTSSFSGDKVGAYADRFYVVKDTQGNYYKLRFLKMGLGNDGGERGRPVIEYDLLD